MEFPIIGVIAPSGVVPKAELEKNTDVMRRWGATVLVHPQVHQNWRFYAGDDETRALAFMDFACEPEIDVLWAARGGSGAVRILPYLDRLTKQYGKPPKKTLYGFSDITLLQEYVRVKWGWKIVHAPMPGTVRFEQMTAQESRELQAVLRGDELELEYALTPVFTPRKTKKKYEGKLLGGNLCMMESVLGTPYAFKLAGSILFIEEVSEALYRIDRMNSHFELSGAFDRVQAIVLGTFSECEDKPPAGLRTALPKDATIREMFAELGASLGVPVFDGLKVGHGNGTRTLPLGVSAELKTGGAKPVLRVEL